MPLLSPRIRPLLALMQGLLRSVRGGRLALHFDVSRPGPGALTPLHQPLLVPPPGRTPTIERLGARGGPTPAARDGRVARPGACASRRDLSDVRSHPESPGG